MNTTFLTTLFLFTFGFTQLHSAAGDSSNQTAYLFSSFRGNGEDGLHLAFSHDGLSWKTLQNDRPFLRPIVGGKLMRDPCIIFGPDQRFHMVWTTSWTDRGIGIAHSRDLIEWSEQKFVPVMEDEANARNCWAPEIIWDPEGEQYVIYWATTIPDQFTETAQAADKGWNHRIYYTTTKDFESYSATELFYNPGFNVIDSTIVRLKDRYLMITKDETRYPPAKNLHLASSSYIIGPWTPIGKSFSPPGVWVEGPTSIQIGDYWYVYFDCYRKHQYGAMRTRDFAQWEDVSDRIEIPEGMRHGTVFSVPQETLARIQERKKNRE